MPIYLYRCNLDNCKYQFEVFRSIKSDFLTDCPACDQPSLSVIPFAVSVLSKQEPKTVGLLADRNTEKLGRYTREDLWAKQEENKKIAKKAAREQLAEKLPRGASPIEPADSPGQFDKVDLSLADLTPKQTEKYIYEGVKP